MKKYFTAEEKAAAVKESKRRYRETHREKLKASGAKYREENREKISEYGAARYRKIKDSHNEAMKLWRQENLDKMCAYQAKRRATELERTPKWLSQEQLEEIQEWYHAARELSKIFPWKLHVDHIVPLAGNSVSGFHVPWNLQLLPATANLSKSNKWEVLNETDG